MVKRTILLAALILAMAAGAGAQGPVVAPPEAIVADGVPKIPAALA